MRIGVFGTGMVGDALSKALSKLGHEVTVGARSSDSESLQPFADEGLLTGSFADAAITSDLVINATNGNFSVEAVASAAAELDGKTLIDLSNRLDHSKGMAAAALAAPDNSVAADIQAAVPGVNVVKALNTMNCNVMVDPSLVPGDHVVFVSGDSAEAKQQVKDLLAQFGWREQQIVDLGGLETATGPEMLMQLWLDVVVARGGFGAGPFNFAING
ncbi:MAG: NAD(P)-binding domain-containing protein [Thermoleophilaceae bacterium]|nr:NAD(P)-binding domain-containing protein [Thermoleophilaceae bacterium]